MTSCGHENGVTTALDEAKVSGHLGGVVVKVVEVSAAAGDKAKKGVKASDDKGLAVADKGSCVSGK